MGPVQEKDTKESVNAIKNMPTNPPLSEAESALLTHLLGRVISKAPKNEAAKNINIKKKKRLNQGFADMAFNPSGPIIRGTINPRET